MNTLPPTTPHGALSPALAAKLDELSDQGRNDKILSDLGINPGAETRQPLEQRELFQEDGKGGFISFDGQQL